MAYYADLTQYTYHDSEFYRPGTKNIGWLSAGHEFEKTEPSEEVLEALWNFCRVSVAQMRGGHLCACCPPPELLGTERRGETLLLGTSEIRVFSESGEIYAAPTLIYHYVKEHHYQPPAQFVRALIAGPAPPSEAFFDRLRAVGLDWNRT